MRLVASSAERSEIQQVDELTGAYVRVLENTWSSPTTGQGNPELAVIDNDSTAVKRLGWPGLVMWPLRLIFRPVRPWWYGFMLGPVISLYVNTHINSSVSKLSKTLIKKRLQRDSLNELEAAGLDRSIETLERLQVVTTGWIVLLTLLRFVPIIGLLFSMGIVTVGISLQDTPDLLLQLIGLLPLIVLFVHPLLVHFGFRWKRALFAGSSSVIGSKITADTANWPTQSTYEIEARTFKRLGIKRPTEFPVDLFLAPGVYMLLNITIGLVIGSITFDDSVGPNEIPIGNIISVTVFAIFLATAVFRLVLRYMQRRAAGTY